MTRYNAHVHQLTNVRGGVHRVLGILHAVHDRGCGDRGVRHTA